MDGKSRWADNVLIERWFRSFKCEWLYINEYKTPRALKAGITAYIEKYNNERPHSAHGGISPAEAYRSVFAGTT
jgi:putative transposase